MGFKIQMRDVKTQSDVRIKQNTARMRTVCSHFIACSPLSTTLPLISAVTRHNATEGCHLRARRRHTILSPGVSPLALHTSGRSLQFRSLCSAVCVFPRPVMDFTSADHSCHCTSVYLHKLQRLIKIYKWLYFVYNFIFIHNLFLAFGPSFNAL